MDNIPEYHKPPMTMAKLIEFFMYNHEASKYINWENPIVVCVSGAGYYIGQMEPDGSPSTRLSVEYWRTYEEAQDALDNFQFCAKTWL